MRRDATRTRYIFGSAECSFVPFIETMVVYGYVGHIAENRNSRGLAKRHRCIRHSFSNMRKQTIINLDIALLQMT